MGILDKIGLSSKSKMFDCKDNDDGTTTCVKATATDNGDLLATGEQITFGFEPKSCNIVTTGNIRLAEDDLQAFNKIMAEKQKACRMGLK